MTLKPQDILVLLKIAISSKGWSYNKLALELGMSPSEVHSAVKRAERARLIQKDEDSSFRLIRRAFEEFLIHGLQYVFVPEHGSPTRGIPTSYAAAPLKKHFVKSNDLPPVWPDPEGTVKGYEFPPLYKSAPKAAKNDPKLYELLALVDAIRDGRAREKEIAIKELKNRLSKVH